MISLPFSEPIDMLIKGCVAAHIHLMMDLETDFSRTVYTTGLADLEAIEELREKLKPVKNSTFIKITEDELCLIYVSVFLNAKMFADDAAFFKWFFEHDMGEVDSVENFRTVNANTYITLCRLLYENFGTHYPTLVAARQKAFDAFGEV